MGTQSAQERESYYDCNLIVWTDHGVWVYGQDSYLYGRWSHLPSYIMQIINRRQFFKFKKAVPRSRERR